MKITVYDANGIIKAAGLTAVAFTATPTSAFDASVSISGGTANIALAMDNQTGNVVFASPSDGSSNTPGFRVLVAADLTSALVSPPPIGTTTPNTGYFAALRQKIGGFFGIFTHANTGDRTYTFPNYDGTLATLAGSEVLTNKTIGVSQLSGAVSEANGGTAQSTYAQGDILYASAANTLAKLTKGTAFQLLRMNSGDTVLEWGRIPYIQLQDQKTQNTAGGTFTSGSWQTRTVNTEVTDTDSLCSLSSNQFTLSAGTYYIQASATGCNVNRHQARLQNTTGATTLLTGTSELTGTTALKNTKSIIAGVFTVAASQALEIQHQCQTTGTSNGFGTEANFTTEVYLDIQLWRVA